ncbi:TonB-dependent receptor [Sphingomonas sp.]|uniref:TonB-dependent receptor n=1 Tax=Sphingomonas sp. TaxID=28214 RepID=UPI002B898592|nr:TonB-dependent receptor [Sphingomonas sp.]HTG37865.1 TonB-dependent receptor [Sphingomonas sp.]
MPSFAAAQDAGETVATSAQDIPTDSGDIVVTAIQRSLESAQAIKQDSDEIVDSVVAEDIGRLPDVTASESLARITGVQVERNGGTAQAVRIRGLPDLTTTYNGREVFTAEGRFVALQDFPANTIARIDVYKSASANLLEPGLAGLVDVRSRKPLDFKGDRIAGGVTGLHFHQSQQTGVEANLLISKRWSTGIGEIGFLVEGAYAEVKFRDSARNVAQAILNRTNVPGFTGQALRIPQFVNTDYTNANRWRPNAAAAFQWRPSPQLEFYLDGLFQGYRSSGEGRNYQVVSGDAAVLSNVVLIPGTNQIKSATATGGGLPIGGQGAADQTTNTYQGGGGFNWRDGPLRITGDAAYTESTFINENFRMNFTNTLAPTRNFDFDTDQGVGGGTVSLVDFDLFNPALYRWTNLAETGSRSFGKSVQARLDVDYKLDRFGISNLQAGLRFADRDANSYSYNRTTQAPPGQLFSLLPLEYETTPAGFRNDQAHSIRTFLVPTRDSLVENADLLRSMVGLQPGKLDYVEPEYTSNEKTYTSYVQARYDFDIGVPIDGLIGLRATRTEATINGTTRSTVGTGPDAVTTITPITRTSSYDDYLPNVSTRVRFSRDLQLRLAYTKTRTRPGFGQLNPTLTIGAPPQICTVDPANPDSGPDNPGCVRSASSGNPDLQPIESNNYDASLEYYFSRSGSITAGVFRKDLQGFINNFQTEVTDAEFGRLLVSRPENGGAGRIDGVEAGARTFFRAPWLPTWLGNFGAMVNYTYLDATSELAPSLAETLPGQQRIAGVSKHLVNLSGFFETRNVSTRLSYNYRSDFVTGYGRVNDPALGANVLGPTLPIIERGRGTLDLAATLTPIENITLTFNATNLLGTAVRNSRQFNALDQVYPFQTRFLESVYRLGIRFRF